MQNIIDKKDDNNKYFLLNGILVTDLINGYDSIKYRYLFTYIYILHA